MYFGVCIETFCVSKADGLYQTNRLPQWKHTHHLLVIELIILGYYLYFRCMHRNFCVSKTDGLYQTDRLPLNEVHKGNYL